MVQNSTLPFSVNSVNSKLVPSFKTSLVFPCYVYSITDFLFYKKEATLKKSQNQGGSESKLDRIFFKLCRKFHLALLITFQK